MPRTRIVRISQLAPDDQVDAAAAAFRALVRQPQHYLAAARGGVISAGANALVNTSLFRLQSLLMQLHAVSLVPIWVATRSSR
jgi:hypothetical protein